LEENPSEDANATIGSTQNLARLFWVALVREKEELVSIHLENFGHPPTSFQQRVA